MTLEQLRIFVAVAEREHIRRAAEALHLTQSAVSAAIRAIEERHDVALFHRVGRRIELTEAGRLFHGEAAAVLARARAAERLLDDLGALVRGTLPVAASQTVSNYWLPQRLVRFRADHPGIATVLHVGNTAEVVGRVLDGSVDLGIVEGEVDAPALAGRTVAHDRMVIVVAPGHPWTQVPPVNAAVLAEADWVLREPGSGTRSVFEAALLRHGIEIPAARVVLELPSNEAVCSAVAAGGGVTAISEHVVEALVASGRLAVVAFALPPRRFVVHWHKERQLGAAAYAFLQMIGCARNPQ
ncbi:LysR family transcriptional regulator [Azospirillum soli]|uniref:LysR family transcriptional regulator n=1 Tax=Azospirillum soli TaxID=1304799 RepID=UPI001AE2EAD9|nr:LysR family transcriptional regulator [Azospirillum soli]MBP2316384.1 DNA-binding transcriptional LysR family regulator [Azospirillum soli]